MTQCLSETHDGLCDFAADLHGAAVEGHAAEFLRHDFVLRQQLLQSGRTAASILTSQLQSCQAHLPDGVQVGIAETWVSWQSAHRNQV